MTIEQAEAELQSFTEDFERRNDRANWSLEAVVRTYADEVTGDVRSPVPTWPTCS